MKVLNFFEVNAILSTNSLKTDELCSITVSLYTLIRYPIKPIYFLERLHMFVMYLEYNSIF